METLIILSCVLVAMKIHQFITKPILVATGVL